MSMLDFLEGKFSDKSINLVHERDGRDMRYKCCGKATDEKYELNVEEYSSAI